ncbi:amidohydrolase family protein [Bradyrhizobium diazoefficiens]|uniref:amidohydrolase family protein n=1 Tax=Bradyrhizobium diazoefficiens TaxID=1355477 RepID=UPI0034809C8C
MSNATAASKTMARMIDVHHHIVPDEYVKALSRKGVTKALGVPLPKWNLETALEVMDGHDIETAIISISAPGVYFGRIDEPLAFARELSRQTNEVCAELIAKRPSRFGAFATLPLPDIDLALDELNYASDQLKLDGVVLLSNYDGYYLGDPKFEALYAELNRRKVTVFIHPSTPPGLDQSHLGLPEAMLDVCFDTTRTAFSLVVNGVMKRYPDIRFILAHAGGAVPYLAARVGLTATLLSNTRGIGPAIGDAAGFVSRIFPGLRGSMPDLLKYYINFKENVLPEGPDFYLGKFYYDTALSASPHAFASLLTIVDSSHILFGSDYVFATRAAVPLTVGGVNAHPAFGDVELAAIASKNAAHLFPRLAGLAN